MTNVAANRESNPSRLALLLQTRPAFMVLMAAFTAFVRFTYVDFIATSPVFKYAGAIAYPAVSYSILLGYIFSLLPVLWLRLSPKRVSDQIVLYLYAFVYVPTCLLIPSTTQLDWGDQLYFMAMICSALGALELRRLFGLWSLPEFAIESPALYEAVLFIALLACGAYLIWFGELDLADINFVDVYERRALLLANGGGLTIALVFYIANWSSLALAPISLILGIANRNYALGILSLLVAIASFAATSFKSNFFIPIIAGAIYLIGRRFHPNWNGYVLILSVFVTSILCVMIDLLVNYAPLMTWAFEFRMIGNNGFLSGKYFAFFHGMPKGLFGDSIGAYFIDPVYSKPISEIVGEDFSQVPGNHANAHLWADGYGNLGAWGMAFASAEALLFLWLADSFTWRKDIRLTAPIALPAAFSLANTSVHSTLTSNGGLLLLLLLLFLPQITGNGSPRGDAR